MNNLKIKHLIIAVMAVVFSFALSGCERLEEAKFVGKWHITKCWNQSIMHDDLIWYVRDEDGIDLELRSDHHLVVYQNGVLFPDWDPEHLYWRYDAETNELILDAMQIIHTRNLPVESITKTHMMLHKRVVMGSSVVNEHVLELVKK